MKRSLHLLPAPRRITRREAVCSLQGGVTVAGPEVSGLRALMEALATACAVRAVRSLNPDAKSPVPAIRLRWQAEGEPQGYRLVIRKREVEITGADPAGLYYGIQTLRQILAQSGPALPCLRIEDRPDFPVRGFYHDVARGKVPKRETLLGLIEKMAYYKLNQLQLYVEHTFAFRGYPEVWAGSDPLTAEDILVLDEHARRHHVDLVPSLSTFGHFCTFLKSPRLEHLNELPVKASRLPFSWVERLGHYTLDCANPDSLAVVEDLVSEYAPLFRSRLFNICCDETFDLGRGRNRARAERLGKGRLYLDFVKKIMRAVRAQGKTPMLWGDIILNHPHLVADLPRDAVVLNWDYSTDLARGGSDLFAESGRRFYVCPGVHGWRGWLNQVNDATANIVKQAAAGRRYGAEGLLTTDWGDCGHVSFLSGSYPGLLLGAAAGWHTDAQGEDDIGRFDQAAGALELGDATGRLMRLIRRLGDAQAVDWKDLVHWLEGERQEDGDQAGLGLPAARMRATEAAYTRMGKYRDQLDSLLVGLHPTDPLLPDELRCSAEGADLVLMTALALGMAAGHVLLSATRPVPKPGEIADRVRRFEARVSRLWHKRNRPSEYFRVRLALLDIALRLDRLT
jgi:hypothetical protein